MSKAKPVKAITDLRPQVRNANRHTLRGLGLLEDSIQQDGWIGAITVAADGETFDGSARVEVGAAAGFADAIVVESDGSKPVIVRRTDIATADDPRAVRLGVKANRIAQVDLDWDADVLATLAAEGVVLHDLWSESELSELLGQAQNGEWADALGGLPNGDKAPFQQMTFTVSDAQAEVVKRAMSQAKATGHFEDTGNENSNGNALACICEGFLDGNG